LQARYNAKANTILIDYYGFPELLTDVATQPAHAADRCAHEIIAILTVLAVRLRRLMGKPLGRCPSTYYLIKR